MPSYLHECAVCKKEIELFYSIKAPVPPCPDCNSELKRLINCTAKGVVELTGHELTSKLKADGIKLGNEAAKNERVMADMVGETKYNDNVKARDHLRREWNKS